MAVKLTFEQARQQHEVAKSKGLSIGQMSLSDFSNVMQQNSPNDWSAGQLPDNMIGDVSRGIDSALESTGLPKTAGQMVGGFGQIADQLTGQQTPRFQTIAEGVGEGLPRMLAQTGLTLGGFAAGGVPGIAMASAGIADAGAKAYTDTGSVKQGVTAAALMGLGPKVIAPIGAWGGAKLIPKALQSSPVAQFAAAEVGGQTAFMGAITLGQLANDENPFTMDNLFANAVGSLAFAPITAMGGMRAFKEARALERIKAEDARTDGGMLIQRPGTLDQGQGASFVDSNNQTQLARYLMGEPDAQLPESLKTGNLMQALRATGLERTDIDSSSVPEALMKREKGKELVQKAGQMDNILQPGFQKGTQVQKFADVESAKAFVREQWQNGAKRENFKIEKDGDGFKVAFNSKEAPRQEMVFTEDFDALVRRASKLLETEPRHLVDTIKIIQTANQFEARWKYENAKRPLLPAPEGSGAIIPHPFARTAAEAAANDFATSQGNRVGPRAAGYRGPRDPNTIELGPPRTEAEQADMVAPVRPPGAAPFPVRGKAREGNFTAERPDVSRMDEKQLGFAENLGPYSEPTGMRPKAVKGKQPIDLATKQRSQNSYADPFGFELIRQGLKDLGDTKGFARLLGEEKRLMGEPSGRDVNGAFTVKSMRAELERLNNVEATPDVAQARLMQKVKNQLEDRIGVVMPKNLQELGTQRVMEAAFNNMGLHSAMRETYVAAAHRIMETMNEPKIHVMSLEDAVPNLTGPTRGLQLGNTVAVKTGVSGDLTGVAGAHDTLVTLAHESTHALLDRLDNAAYLGVDNFRINHAREARDYASTLLPEDRANLLAEAHKALLPEKSQVAIQNLKDSVKYAKGSAEEFLVEYAALNAMSKASAETKRNFLRFIPEPLQDFVKTVYRGIDELRKMVIAGVDTNALPGGLEALNKFHTNIDMIYSKDPVIEGMRASVNNALSAPAAIERGDIGGRTIQFRKVAGSEEASKIADRMEQLKQGNAFTRNVLQHQQISAGSYYRENLPEYNALVSALTTQDGLAVTFQHSMRRDFMVSVDGGFLKELTTVNDKKLTPEQIAKKSTLKRVEESEVLHKAVDDSMRKTRELVRDAALTGSAYPDFSHPEIQNILKDLNAEQKADVKHVYESYLKANKVAADHQVTVEAERLKYVAADYLLGSGLSHKDAKVAGGVVMSALMQEAPHMIPPDLLANPGTQAMIKHWEAVKDKFYAFKNNLDRPHFTEFRSGRYGFRYEEMQTLPDGTTKMDIGYRSTNDKLQRTAIRREIQADPRNRIIEEMDHYKDPKGRYGQMQTRGMEEATNLVRAHYDAAMAAMKPEMAALFEDSLFDPAQPLVAAMKQELQTMAHARLAPGREKINMIAAQDAYSSLIARKMANTMTRLETNWLLKSDKWNQAKTLKQEMQDFRDHALAAGRQEFQTFRKLTTAVTMAGNVSSALVDSSQPFTMGIWRATQEVGFQKALGMTVKGFAEAFKPIDKIADTEFRKLLIDVTNKGYLKTGGSMDNFISTDDAVNYNVIRAGSNRDLVDMRAMLTDGEFLAGKVFEQFSSLGSQAFELGMTPMRLSAQINNKSALYNGYQLAKAKGLKGEALTQYAINHMQVVNLQGSRAAHSSFKMKAGQANGLVEAATLMTNYPIAVFGEMVSNWQGMLKSSNLSPEVRARSAQAFAGQVLTQMALAGVTGLGLKGLFEFAKGMFGVDAEKAIREGMATIDESGTLGEVLLNGVANSITGVDISSRFDLSGVGGFNPYTGFDAKGLFGAGGGLISALYNAPADFAKGDVSKMRLIPTGIRRVLTSNSDQAYTDKNGQRLIEPDAGDKFAMMLGFKPARMSQVLEQRSTMRSVEQKVSEQGLQRKAKMLSLMQDNKMESVQQLLNEEILLDLQSPEFQNLMPYELEQVKAKLHRTKMLELVNYGAEKLMPFDSLETGAGETGVAKSQAAQGFGTHAPPRASEVQRTVLKQSMMEKLGIKVPMSNGPKAVRTAMMVDALIQQNPTMTRSQALAIAQGK